MALQDFVRLTNSPPQLGQAASIEAVQFGQKVHSQEQMKASDTCVSGAWRLSHSVLISSAMWQFPVPESLRQVQATPLRYVERQSLHVTGTPARETVSPSSATMRRLGQSRPAMLGVGRRRPYIEAVFRGRRGDAAFGPQERQQEEQPWNSGW